MNLDINALIDAVSGQPLLLVLFLAVASLLEAGLGLGAVVPGETVVVLGSAVLSSAGWGWVLTGVVLVAAGASLGDHLGFFIGYKAGPPLRNSSLVKSMGRDNWDKAMGFVERQGILPLVIGRQLPGVRTLVSASCGAARISYPRFLAASLIGSTIWSIVWAGGGALFGNLVITYLSPVLPWFIAGWLLILVGVFTYRRIRSRRRSAGHPGSKVVRHVSPAEAEAEERRRNSGRDDA